MGENDDGPVTTIEEVALAEPAGNVLARRVRVKTDRPARVEVESVRDGERLQSRSSTEPSVAHELLVLGFHPEASHELTVRAEADRASATVTRTVTTGPLPDDVPPVHVKRCDPSRVADGYRLLSLVRWEQTDERTHRPDRDWGMALALDGRGRVVWYYRADHPIWGATPTPRGTIVYNAAPHAVVEIDMAGNVLGEWRADRDLGRRLGGLVRRPPRRLSDRERPFSRTVDREAVRARV
ncbi:MAG: hypothetical protein ABEL76_10210 [Bradymonadaceae bacterium]